MHGLEGSTADHWQNWLVARLEETGESTRFPELPDAAAPSSGAWRAALEAELDALPGPPEEHVVVCHSLACIAWLLHAAEAGRSGAAPRRRVLLVAPPSASAGVPEIAAFFPVELDGAGRAAARSTVLVCSDDDPYCPEGAAAAYGAPLGLETHVLPGGGHLNPDAALGPWPEVAAWARSGVWPSGREPDRPGGGTP